MGKYPLNVDIGLNGSIMAKVRARYWSKRLNKYIYKEYSNVRKYTRSRNALKKLGLLLRIYRLGKRYIKPPKWKRNGR